MTGSTVVMIYGKINSSGRGSPLHSLALSHIADRRMEYTLALTDIADEEVRKQIVAPLARYNESKAGPNHYRPLVVAARNAEGNVIGGMWGATGYGWLYTQLLVVPAELRGSGVGTRLMQFAEEEAIARGCHSSWLDTHEFQARPFYERLGYVCFGELPNYPTGFSRIFLKKTLGAMPT